MRNLWKRMRARVQPQDSQAVDAWAKEGLRVSVPEGSFERVWAGFVSRVERRRPPVGERDLQLAVRWSRTWTRALVGGLAVVTVILVIAGPFDDALPGRPHVTAHRIQAVRTAFAIRGVTPADADSSRHTGRPEAERLVRGIQSVAAMFDFGASMRKFWADPTTFTRRMREVGPVERKIQAFKRAVGIA